MRKNVRNAIVEIMRRASEERRKELEAFRKADALKATDGATSEWFNLIDKGLTHSEINQAYTVSAAIVARCTFE